MQTEKQLTNQILNYAKSQPNLFLYKRYASGNEAGKPDLTGVYLLDSLQIGLRIEIEVKAPRLLTSALIDLQSHPEALFKETFKIASKRQQYWLKKFKSYGCLTGVVLDLSHVDLLIAQLNRPT